jgi:uncharacterized protein (DUF302 family)
MRMHVTALAMAAALAFGATAQAQDVITFDWEGSFDDATFAVESAILDRGLVIDLVSHVGEMLNRTGGDVGSDEMIFDQADIFLFCSAAISRRVMEADPMNIVHCPYSIFVTETDGQVMIGHRAYPDGPMQEVEALLDHHPGRARAIATCCTSSLLQKGFDLYQRGRFRAVGARVAVKCATRVPE